MHKRTYEHETIAFNVCFAVYISEYHESNLQSKTKQIFSPINSVTIQMCHVYHVRKWWKHEVYYNWSMIVNSNSNTHKFKYLTLLINGIHGREESLSL